MNKALSAGVLVAFCAMTATSIYAITDRPAPEVRVVRVVTTVTPKPVIKYRTRWRTKRPSPAPSNPPSPPATADWSMQIACSQVQCTTYPGAGPYGGTCQPPVNGMQWCYGKPTGNPSDPCSVSGLCR